MNVADLNQLAETIRAAQLKDRTPMGIALAIASAGQHLTVGMRIELAQAQALQNPQPAELSEIQLDALVDAGNGALNDHYHERQCACSEWPANCSSSGDYFAGAWDTDAFAIGVAAVLGLWESMRAPVEADQIARLRQANAAYERNLERRAAENEALERRARALQEKNAKLVAELEAARSRPAPLLDTVAASELVRSGHFHEAARLLEDTGRHDDAANLLDLLADGVREQAAGRAVPSEAPAPHFYRLGRDLPEVAP